MIHELLCAIIVLRCNSYTGQDNISETSWKARHCCRAFCGYNASEPVTAVSF